MVEQKGRKVEMEKGLVSTSIHPVGSSSKTSAFCPG